MISVYTFGLKRPFENANLVYEQFELARRYRYVRTIIEQGRRAAIREALLLHPPVVPCQEALAIASTKAAEAVMAVKEARIASGKRAVPEPLVEALRAARTVQREASRELREARKRAMKAPLVMKQLEAIGVRANQLERSARGTSGLYWGNYQLVEKAIDQARKMPLFDDNEANDPTVARRVKSDQVGVQIQVELSGKDLFGESTLVRIAPVDQEKLSSPVRSERRKAAKTVLSLRVGSGPKGRPIFARWAMSVHRLIPPEARITGVVVLRRRLGTTESWECQVTAKIDDEKMPRLTASEGIVAIDVGWRKIGPELRVARWRGSDGESGELRLSGRLLQQASHIDSLQSIRDQLFNDTVGRLTSWIDAHRDIVPPWLLEDRRTMPQWRSPARFVRLLRMWNTRRFAGDDVSERDYEQWLRTPHKARTNHFDLDRLGIVIVRAFLKEDQHLWDWEATERVLVAKWRKKIYENFAADLRRRYHVVCFEDFDLRTMAVDPRKTPEAQENQNDAARGNRVLANISCLRSVTESSFLHGRGRAIRVPAHDTTRACGACGHVQTFDAATEIVHVCVSCEMPWDQDDNAAENLLARAIAKERAREVEPAKDAAPRESKWGKVKRAKKEREDATAAE